ncbi:MAG TPA: ATP-binding protein [Streptosporangiaceae bacterium]|nr:ATP-binding protein [Streptosporangiaceae bacterium]
MHSTSGSTGVARSLAPRPRRSRLEIAIAPSAVRAARQWAADQLAVLDPEPERDLIDAAVLVVSELVTNAIQAVRTAEVPPVVPVAPVPGRPVLRLGDLSFGASMPGGAAAPRIARVALVIERRDQTVRIEVYDSSCTPLPAPRDGDDDEETGRGLTVIAALATDWGWRPDSLGKVVWCELAG